MEKLILTKYFYPLKQGGTENFFGGIYFGTFGRNRYPKGKTNKVNSTRLSLFAADLPRAVRLPRPLLFA
ncbi:MAG: hypothetical protein IKT33_01350, partial [Clostridia bacterium]|nr:hypothetical protein [Clostridia bacterium]